MCSLTALAPADVPPTTAPRAYAARIASPNRVPAITCGEDELVPARHEDAVDVVEAGAHSSGSSASSRVCGRSGVVGAAPSERNTSS